MLPPLSSEKPRIPTGRQVVVSRSQARFGYYPPMPFNLNSGRAAEMLKLAKLHGEEARKKQEEAKQKAWEVLQKTIYAYSGVEISGAAFLNAIQDLANSQNKAFLKQLNRLLYPVFKPFRVFVSAPHLRTSMISPKTQETLDYYQKKGTSPTMMFLKQGKNGHPTLEVPYHIWKKYGESTPYHPKDVSTVSLARVFIGEHPEGETSEKFIRALYQLEDVGLIERSHLPWIKKDCRTTTNGYWRLSPLSKELLAAGTWPANENNMAELSKGLGFAEKKDDIGTLQLKVLLLASSLGVTGWDMLQQIQRLQQQKSVFTKLFRKSIGQDDILRHLGWDPQKALPSLAVFSQLAQAGYLKNTGSPQKPSWELSPGAKNLIQHQNLLVSGLVTKDAVHQMLQSEINALNHQQQERDTFVSGLEEEYRRALNQWKEAEIRQNLSEHFVEQQKGWVQQLAQKMDLAKDINEKSKQQTSDAILELQQVQIQLKLTDLNESLLKLTTQSAMKSEALLAPWETFMTDVTKQQVISDLKLQSSTQSFAPKPPSSQQEKTTRLDDVLKPADTTVENMSEKPKNAAQK